MNSLLKELEERVLDLESKNYSSDGVFKILRKEIQLTYTESKKTEATVIKLNSEVQTLKKDNEILSRKIDSILSKLQETKEKKDFKFIF